MVGPRRRQHLSAGADWQHSTHCPSLLQSWGQCASLPETGHPARPPRRRRRALSPQPLSQPLSPAPHPPPLSPPPSGASVSPTRRHGEPLRAPRACSGRWRRKRRGVSGEARLEEGQSPHPGPAGGRMGAWRPCSNARRYAPGERSSAEPPEPYDRQLVAEVAHDGKHEDQVNDEV